MVSELTQSRRWQAAFCAMLVFAAGYGLLEAVMKATIPRTVAAGAKYSAAALRQNTLGVAYMNQQKSPEAQKYFERALAADPNFAEARLNLGISLLGQQKLEAGRAALQEAASKLPNDPYAWYNLGLACGKIVGDPRGNRRDSSMLQKLRPTNRMHITSLDS